VRLNQAVEVSKKLEKARDSIKFLFQEKYEERILPWKNLIRNVSKKYKISTFQAAIKLTEDRGSSIFGNDGMTVLVILSAACDLVEEKI